MMRIEIIYALPGEQKLVQLDLPEGATCRDALVQSEVLEKYALSLENIKVGIFSNHVELDHVLKDRDRIEIYRPLTIDPKEARRIRAEKKRKEQNLHKFGA